MPPSRRVLGPTGHDAGHERHEVVARVLDSYLVATLGHYVIVLIKGRLGAAGVGAFTLANETLAKRYARIGHLLVIYPEHRMPDPSDREAIAGMVSRFRSVIGAAAIVHEGGSRRASLTSAMVTTIHLASQAGHATRVFDDAGEASVWLDSKVPATSEFTAVDLRASVRLLRLDLP